MTEPAMTGESAGYVNCEDEADVFLNDFEGTMYGLDSGYADDSPTADADTDSPTALNGATSGYVPGTCEEDIYPNPIAVHVNTGSLNTSLTSTFLAIGVHTTDPTRFDVIRLSLFGVGGVTASTPAGWTAHPDNGIAAGNTTSFLFYRVSGILDTTTIVFSGPSAYAAASYSVSGAVGFYGWATRTGTGTPIGMGSITGLDHTHFLLIGRGGLDAHHSAVSSAGSGTDLFFAGPTAYGESILEGFLIHDWPTEAAATHEITSGAGIVTSGSWACLTVAFYADGGPGP